MIVKQSLKIKWNYLEETSKQRGDEGLNLALLTDGLRSEREQGITIDVAYRYFATQKENLLLLIHQDTFNTQEIWLLEHQQQI